MFRVLNESTKGQPNEGRLGWVRSVRFIGDW